MTKACTIVSAPFEESSASGSQLVAVPESWVGTLLLQHAEVSLVVKAMRERPSAEGRTLPA